jgi:hypothetical protein
VGQKHLKDEEEGQIKTYTTYQDHLHKQVMKQEQLKKIKKLQKHQIKQLKKKQEL